MLSDRTLLKCSSHGCLQDFLFTAGRERTEGNEDPAHIEPEGQQDDHAKHCSEEQRPLEDRANCKILLRAVGLLRHTFCSVRGTAELCSLLKVGWSKQTFRPNYRRISAFTFMSVPTLAHLTTQRVESTG